MVMLSIEDDEELPQLSKLTGATNAKVTSISSTPTTPYSNIMSLRNKRKASCAVETLGSNSDKEPSERCPIDITDCSVENAPLLALQKAQVLNSLSPSNPVKKKDKPTDYTLSDEELSDLDGFTHIDRLVMKGGDLAKRAEFILNQFGRGRDCAANASTSHRSSTLSRSTKTRSSPSKIPGLHPTSASNNSCRGRPARSAPNPYINRQRN